MSYTDSEDDTWRGVCGELVSWHRHRACAEIRQAIGALAIPAGHAPQQADVSARLRELTGFQLTPAPGAVTPSRLYEAMADGYFPATTGSGCYAIVPSNAVSSMPTARSP